MQFVPFWNSLAGLTLTPTQWSHTGVQSFAFDLNLLLQRPGIGLSKSLREYTHCFGKIIIDARAIQPNKNLEIDYRTPDGAKQKISIQQLDFWLNLLNPDKIIVNEQLILEKNRSKTLMLTEASSNYYISDEPASSAIQGFVMQNSNQVFNILDEQFAHDHQPLVNCCECKTCKTGFTRSYLHHLLGHTPLLAQRFLVQHNIWQICNYLG